MAINAVKKILMGETNFDSGTIGTAEVAASAITAAKVAASAINANGLKWKTQTFSLLAGAVGILSGASTTYSLTITNGAKFLGMYLTALTSHANVPIVTPGAAAILVSVAQALIGSDVCEGVIITVEP